MKKMILLVSLLLFICPSLVFAESEVVTLESCVDGDTAKFKSQDGTVTTYRFLAVDTPETVHPSKSEEPFGKEASEFTCTTLTNAFEIVLEFDENAEKKDAYGRGLAWVFVDDVFLQEQLILKGYAEVAYLYDNYKYNTLLQDAQEIAKVSKVGIWSDEIQNESLEAEEIDDDLQDKETLKKSESKNVIEQIVDRILETVVASINEIIDSILQKIEDML